MTKCADCGRQLTRVPVDGLGPVCRRKRRTGDPHRGALGPRPVPGAGQLPLPAQPEPPQAVPQSIPEPSDADLEWLYRAEPMRPVAPLSLHGRRVTTIQPQPAYL
ncbi:hypothetical protein H3146_05885 [Streptomyces sp. OF3]|uniref:Uncharacterized protein n=1 Tax=Streptomyces alkaliterrae TaxID=2213162 RepID=A0A7W3ZM25_9ACTN|nr:hypothetical protein [Streptomyces alkaliterrae]MBB1252897.1 hypothetical protein [Streptomyces alkaliterrae]